MAMSEIDNFIVKFKNLLIAGRIGTLTIKTEAEKAAVNLHVDLGDVLLPPDQHQHHHHHGSRNGPARQRRRNRRAAEREAALAEEAEEQGTHVKSAKATEEVVTTG